MKQGVVRFITAGSVDDGKSTLIGRLLYDTKAILSDQLIALTKTKYARVTAHDAEIDLALLTDGLEAEREQGITIDVAYRYFSTAKRKFIVADAPGHVQYTRNLVTGASQSDVAIVLIDATRVDVTTNPPTLLDQTKRHSSILKLLGVRHVVFAINKMDLIDFDHVKYQAIETEIHELVKALKLPEPVVIPISALLGENVVTRGTKTPWYKGPSLLEWLEDVDLSDSNDSLQTRLGARFPVQLVVRQDGSASEDFRGYLGRLEAGKLVKGQKVRVLPNGQESSIEEIQIANHQFGKSFSENTTAQTGDVICITLSSDIDVSRGDMIVAVEDQQPPLLSKSIRADVCWLDQDALSTVRKYVLRHTTNQVFVKVKVIEKVWDVTTLTHANEGRALQMNDIGQIVFNLQKPIVADAFDVLPTLGSFILIDEATNHTVAAGMIREVLA